MAVQERLCFIRDTFTITGRGTVIVPGEWETGRVKAGDWIEVRRQEGSSVQARVMSMETGRRMIPGPVVMERGMLGGLLCRISREAVKPGDELWSVVNPPSDEPPGDPQDISDMSARPSFWQRVKSKLQAR